MDIEFRKAKLEDIEGVINLCNHCFDEETSITKAKDIFLKTENDENQIYLIGILDNKIVAHTKITIVPTLFDGMETYAILNHVCVHPEYRRHNIATKMLNCISQICREKNCISIKLWSKNFREAAHACYKKYGFDTIDATFFEMNLR